MAGAFKQMRDIRKLREFSCELLSEPSTHAICTMDPHIRPKFALNIVWIPAFLCTKTGIKITKKPLSVRWPQSAQSSHFETTRAYVSELTEAYGLKLYTREAVVPVISVWSNTLSVNKTNHMGIDTCNTIVQAGKATHIAKWTNRHGSS